MPDSRPRIVFNSESICNGCVTASRKSEIDWSERRKELDVILEKKKSSQNGYDCVVAWSGGKDSSAVALKLKNDVGLRPLLVTFSPLIPTEEGVINRNRMQEIGFDQIMVSPNKKVSSQLSRKFFIERGDPKIHWNAGINSAPIQIARALDIPFVFFAEHGESEYGGKVIDEESQKKRNVDEILENQIGDDPTNWISQEISAADIFPYDIALKGDEKDPEVLYFSYFFPWDIYQNFQYVSDYFEFQTNLRGRTYGTFTNFDSLDDVMDDLYYYMQFIKFGFGRCLRDCARQIQRGHLNIKQAMEYISMYDGEYPADSIDQCLYFLKMTEIEFESIVYSHRREDIWVKKGLEWSLRHKLSTADWHDDV
jgi:N-acetyl sugar amidotransferase